MSSCPENQGNPVYFDNPVSSGWGILCGLLVYWEKVDAFRVQVYLQVDGSISSLGNDGHVEL